ncbi:dynamin family protein [Geminocystis sp. CENA526]|uniref:dynamin family protein n=1 Tax=Geminocystis sp. CENA526 TaxID=1355871 RepID=UPI003D6F4F22
MSRSERIEHIIQQRKPLVEKITNVTNNLYTLTSRIKTLETFKEKLAKEIEDSAIRQNLSYIDFTDTKEQINAILPNLSKLKTRFDRATLNIGVVGMARQGKSRFLQSLTGLSTEEIPDSNMGFCTGVQSAICHKENITTSGLVWFYSPQELFNEVILPYYDTLNLAPKPDNIYEFAQSILPELLDKSEVNKATYQHLKDYHDHFEDYQKWFQINSNPYGIDKEKIREFVSQISSDGKVKYYNYLPVKKVEIICSFPKSDLGKIVLIDTPGIGDTKLNDPDIMVKTVGEDIDAVIFIKKPVDNSQLEKNDLLLYGTAKSALKELSIELWSFMVLNKIDHEHGNSKQCEALKIEIDRKNMFQKSLVINCTKTEEVNLVLEEVLNYLDNNIIKLDFMYAQSCQNEIDKIHQSLNRELDKAKNILNKVVHDSADIGKFNKNFSLLWTNLTSTLEKLLKQLNENRDKEAVEFTKEVQRTIELARQDKGLPSLEDIEEKANEFKSYNSAYDLYLNQTRAYLSRHFLSLDKGLKLYLDEVKNQVAEVLINQGRLKGLSDKKGIEFIQEIMEKIPDELLPNEENQIKFGFQMLLDFELSYRGFVQHRIRENLDILTPDQPNTLKLSKTSNPEQVLKCLTTAHAEAVYKCEEALESLLCEPSQAAFAIVEEFLDRILRVQNARDEWSTFLYIYRGDIWEDFQKIKNYSKLQQEWLNMIEELSKVNQSDNLKFIQ